MTLRPTVLTLITVAALGGSQAAVASFAYSDPSDISTAAINSAGTTLSVTEGNSSLAAYNALDTLTFSLDTERTSITNDNLPAFLNLTAGASGTDLNASVNNLGGSYALFSGGSDYLTSGAGTFIINSTGVNIDITQGVDAVAFTLNRIQANITVKLFGGAAKDQAIGEAAGYVYDVTSGHIDHALFAYVTDGSSPITRVNVTRAAIGNQFGLDDISFVSEVPEPGSMALVGLGAIMVLKKRRHH